MLTSTRPYIHGWTDDGLPVGITLDQVLYEIRRDDGMEGLVFDPLTLDDVLEGSQKVMLLDALVLTDGTIKRKVEVIQRVMSSASQVLDVTASQVSPPFKRQGAINVAAIFELSDGQTVTIVFHNPDAKNVKSLKPSDELVSWKWLLNKKDITIVVAPEQGIDQPIRQIASRVMKLAEKNSRAFARLNQNRAARMERIEGLKVEIHDLEVKLDGLVKEIEVAKVERDDREAGLTKDPKESWGKAVLQVMNERYGYEPSFGDTYYVKKDGNMTWSVDASFTDGVFYSKLRVDDVEKKSAEIPFDLAKAPEDVANQIVQAISGDETAPTPGTGQTTLPTQGPLPWDGLSDGESVRWFGTKVRLTAINRRLGERGVHREGVAIFVQAKNRGDIAEIRWPDDDIQITWRVNKNAYVIEVVEEVRDGKVISSEVPAPTPTPTPDPTGPDAAAAIAEVDAAYKFYASDEFKLWLWESVSQPTYSPFATAKAMDEAAKRNGGSITWDFYTEPTAMDSLLFDGATYRPKFNSKTDRWITVNGTHLMIRKGKVVGGAQGKFNGWKAGDPAPKNGSSKPSDKPSDKPSAKLQGTKAPPGKPTHVSIDGKRMSIQEAKAHLEKLLAQFDSTAPWPSVTWVLDEADDAIEVPGTQVYVGLVRYRGEVVGRVDLGGDGKAMVFVGKNGAQRVKTPSGDEARYSDDDAPLMIDWLFAGITQPNNQDDDAAKKEWARRVENVLLENKGFISDGRFNPTRREGNRRITIKTENADDYFSVTVINYGDVPNRIGVQFDRSKSPEDMADTILKKVSDKFGDPEPLPSPFEDTKNIDVDASLLNNRIYEGMVDGNKWDLEAMEGIRVAIKSGSVIEGYSINSRKKGSDVILIYNGKRIKVSRIKVGDSDIEFMFGDQSHADDIPPPPRRNLVQYDPGDTVYFYLNKKYTEAKYVAPSGSDSAIVIIDGKERLVDNGSLYYEDPTLNYSGGQKPNGKQPGPTPPPPSDPNADNIVKANAILGGSEWKKLSSDIIGSLATIKNIDDGAMPGFDRTAFVNSITGKIARLSTKNPIMAGMALALLDAAQRKLPKPAITNRHGVWGKVPDWQAYSGLFRPAGDDQAPEPNPNPEPEPMPTAITIPGNSDTAGGSNEQTAIAQGLQRLASGAVTDTVEFGKQLDELADRAEKAGLMETLDPEFNEAADKLTELLQEKAKHV